jgi:hypothetical protein
MRASPLPRTTAVTVELAAAVTVEMTITVEAAVTVESGSRLPARLHARRRVLRPGRRLDAGAASRAADNAVEFPEARGAVIHRGYPERRINGLDHEASVLRGPARPMKVSRRQKPRKTRTMSRSRYAPASAHPAHGLVPVRVRMPRAARCVPSSREGRGSDRAPGTTTPR